LGSEGEEEKKTMEGLKKRKLELDEAGNGELASKEELRFLIEPLAKPQLVDLLAKLCVSYSPSSFLPHLQSVSVSSFAILFLVSVSSIRVVAVMFLLLLNCQ